MVLLELIATPAGACLVLNTLDGVLQFGEDAIKEGMPSGPPSGMEDLFSMFTGGMGGRRGAPRERRGENVVHRLKVGLEEMYIGSTRCAGRPVGSVGATNVCVLFMTCRKSWYMAKPSVPRLLSHCLGCSMQNEKPLGCVPTRITLGYLSRCMRPKGTCLCAGNCRWLAI